MRKRKSSEPPEEENTQSVGERKTVEAQVIRVVHISNLFWLCLGLVIGQLLVFLLKYQDSNPGVGQVVSVGDHGPRYWRRSCTDTGESWEDSGFV